MPEWTPAFPPLSGKQGERSFAYITLKKRLPIILKDCLKQASIETCRDKILELLKELEDNQEIKPFDKPLPIANDNIEEWNSVIKNYKEKNWMSIPWLYAECYLYRRLAYCFIENNQWLIEDWFWQNKTEAFKESLPFIKETSRIISTETHNLEETLGFWIQGALWSNQLDLSIFAGKESFEKEIHTDLTIASQYLLSNHLNDVVSYLNSIRNQNKTIHIVMDNAGAECFSDFCLADFLISKSFCQTFVFHVKSFAWFISDVTAKDVDFVLSELQKIPETKSLGLKWQKWKANGTWLFRPHLFWNSFHAYTHLPEINKELYKEFADSGLVIFKGDLNYRKLIYDCQFPFNYPFSEAIESLNSIPLLALRTCKSDCIVGLTDEIYEERKRDTSNWLTSGKYGVIQFSKPNK